MKTFLVFLSCLLMPVAGFSATLTGSFVYSNASVNLASVGTLDWARWPGYKTKGAGLISNFSVNGSWKSYSNDPRLIGDRTGIKTSGWVGKGFTITVPAATTTRTLILYLGGWNATGKVTATLAGATPLSMTMRRTSSFDTVVTIAYRGDTAGAPLKITYTLGSSTGAIWLQAAALQGASSPPPPPSGSGSATLSWTPPTKNTDGSPLTDLVGFKVYWGTSPGVYSKTLVINNPQTKSWTLNNLSAGTWYFAVSALAASGHESAKSNVASKQIK